MLANLKQFSDIIVKTEVLLYEYDENQIRIKINLALADDSILVIKDYRFNNNTRKYSYHWMKENGELFIRWDNAPHWETISTFPHHKHIENNDNISFSTETEIEAVLSFIRSKILSPPT